MWPFKSLNLLFNILLLESLLLAIYQYFVCTITQPDCIPLKSVMNSHHADSPS